MLSDWVSFLAYPNLFGIKGFVVVVVVKKGNMNIKFVKDPTHHPLFQLNIKFDNTTHLPPGSITKML
jgi:hypothetical protein